MTQVEMIYDNNIIIGFRMEGHAGFNTKGPDILCASLSTASQMTINGVLDWTGLSLEDVIKEMEAGFCHADPIILVPGLHISARKGLHLPDNEEIIYS